MTKLQLNTFILLYVFSEEVSSLGILPSYLGYNFLFLFTSWKSNPMPNAMAELLLLERLNFCKTKQNKIKLTFSYCYNDRITLFSSPVRLLQKSHSNASALFQKGCLCGLSKSQKLIGTLEFVWKLTNTFCLGFQN